MTVVSVVSGVLPILTALTAGVLIGVHSVQAGFDRILLGCAVGAVKDAVGEKRE